MYIYSLNHIYRKKRLTHFIIQQNVSHEHVLALMILCAYILTNTRFKYYLPILPM